MIRVPMKQAANARAFALGMQKKNGFVIRRIVWGLMMAAAERREGEEVRGAMISVEKDFQRRSLPKLFDTPPPSTTRDGPL